MGYDERFRNAYRYAVANGFVGGFNNFHQANYGNGVVYGTWLLPATSVDWQDVPRADLVKLDSGADKIEHVPQMVRAVNRWAKAQGYAGGLPTFEQADYGKGVVCGALLIKPGVTDWMDVPIAHLKVVSIDDVPGMMRGANDFANAHGYGAAIPTFEQADYGHGVVAGINLFKSDYSVWRDVPKDELPPRPDGHNGPHSVVQLRTRVVLQPGAIEPGDVAYLHHIDLTVGATKQTVASSKKLVSTDPAHFPVVPASTGEDPMNFDGPFPISGSPNVQMRVIVVPVRGQQALATFVVDEFQAGKQPNVTDQHAIYRLDVVVHWELSGTAGSVYYRGSLAATLTPA